MEASSRAVMATTTRKLMTTSARPTNLEDSMYQTRRTTIADRSCEQVTTRPYETLVTQENDRGKVRGHQCDSSEIGAAECTYKTRRVSDDIFCVPLREISVGAILSIVRAYFRGQVDKRR